MLTCFNRREKTLACFEALEKCAFVAGVELSAVLVDDGSTDGTVAAVQERFRWVQVERSDGSLFWCRGMHWAFSAALQTGYDYYLWLNDDTTLQVDALARLLDCERSLRNKDTDSVIVVGSTVDELTGTLTYGGERRVSRWRPMRFARVQPGNSPQRCETMNGNIVLISAAAAQRVGNIDPVFEHAMGDTDYAFRANRTGVPVWVAPGIHGTCGKNPSTGTFADRELPLGKRWKQMMSRKGLPWRSWLALTSRHAGVLWPLHFAWPYVRVVALGLIDGLRQRGRQNA